MKCRVGNRLLTRGARTALTGAPLLALLITASYARQEPSPVLSRKAMLDKLPVLVADNRYEPGVRSSMHTHSAGRFIYVLAGGTLRVEQPDGSIAEVTLTTGQTAWRDPERHAIENRGRSRVEILEIEIKTAEPDSLAGDERDDLGPPDGFEETPDRRLLFRNRWGTLVLHRLEHGDALDPWNPGRDRLLYRLTEFEYSFLHEDGLERHTARGAGSWDWYPAGHEPRGVNTSFQAAELIELVLEPAAQADTAPSEPTEDMSGSLPDGESGAPSNDMSGTAAETQESGAGETRGGTDLRGHVATAGGLPLHRPGG